MSINEIDTIVTDWFLVQLVYEPDNEVVGTVLWGIISKDFTGRYMLGDYVCTSKVTAIESDHIVRTHSDNHYFLLGKGDLLVLPLIDLELIRKGIHPLDCLPLN